MYLLLTNLYLGIFYGFYQVFLRNETFFRLNRFYLLGGLLLAFILPIVSYPEWHTNTGEYPRYLAVMQAGEPVVVQGNATNAGYPSAAFVQDMLLYAYIGGCVVAFLAFALRFFRTLRMLRTQTGGEAFSFFSAIRIDHSLAGHEQISRHEQVHAREWHSLDIILMQLAKIINWFNPIVYIYERTVKLQHEYIADGETAADKQTEYAELLVYRAMGVAGPVLANTFSNRRLLKHRVAMLLRHRSPRRSLLRYTLLLPIVVAMVVFSVACNQGKNSNGDTEAAVAADVNADEFIKALGDQLRYSDEALQDRAQGMLAVSYEKSNGELSNIRFLNTIGPGMEASVISALQHDTVERAAPEGKNMIVIDFKISGVEPEDMPPPPPPMSPDYTQLGVLVVMGHLSAPPPPPVDPSKPRVDTVRMPPPKVVPKQSAQEDDKTEPEVIQVRFPEKSDQKPVVEEGTDIVFQSVEINPQPVGGMRSFMKWVADNYDYPQAAIEAGVNGQVQVSFVVEKDGSLTDIKLVRDLKYGTGEAAIRLLQRSSKWSPGIQNGRPVRVAYTLPIRLNLQA
ncbi:TonB family protein [Parapedobacter sp. DT-150]|uniref:TonB family protein n=1 Tax=Parapedobacter sp. DT-150 TaxID=3396162 RepID=UPI003F53E880